MVRAVPRGVLAWLWFVATRVGVGVLATALAQLGIPLLRVGNYVLGSGLCLVALLAACTTVCGRVRVHADWIEIATLLDRRIRIQHNQLESVVLKHALVMLWVHGGSTVSVKWPPWLKSAPRRARDLHAQLQAYCQLGD